MRDMVFDNTTILRVKLQLLFKMGKKKGNNFEPIKQKRENTFPLKEKEE